jgi:hypothetical protein
MYIIYIFSQRQNTSCQESSEKHVMVEFTDVASHDQWVEYLCCNGKPTGSDDDSNIQVCDIYAVSEYSITTYKCKGIYLMSKATSLK